MGDLVRVYESENMYGQLCSTFNAPKGGSAPVAIVELPPDLKARRGMVGDLCVVGEFGTVYELDPDVAPKTYRLHLEMGGDERTPTSVQLTRMTLSKLRKRSGLTQGELAEKIGTSQSQISDWERKRNSLSVLSLAKVAKALCLDQSIVLDVCLTQK